MTRDAFSAGMLIIGSLLGIAVMALHPTAHGILASGDIAAQARLALGVHGAALLATPLVFLGMVGWSRRIGFTNLTTAALVVYGFGCVAVLSAAAMSGFVAPHLVEHVGEAQGAQRELFHTLLAYTGLINQAYAKINVAASALAMLLWSTAMLRGGAARPAAWFGAIVAVLTLGGLVAGLLVLNIHGYGAVVLSQAVWMIWLAVLMLRGYDSSTPRVNEIVAP